MPNIKVVRRSEEFNARLVEVRLTGPGINQELDLPPAGMTDEFTFPLKVKRDERLELVFDVKFSSLGSDTVALKVKALVANLTTIDLHHEDNTSLRIRLEHLAPKQAKATQCAVTCVAGGETKTGEHPSVTCSKGDVSVRLSC